MSNPKRSFNLFRALGFTTNAQPSNSNNNNNTSISSSSSSSSNNNERDHSNDPVTKSTADLQAMLRKSTSNLFAVTSNNAQTPTSATTPTDSLTNKWGDVRASLRMRKLWTEYSRAKDEETKAELLNQIVVLFNRVCPSCDSENFVTCFGDGQTFAFTLCRKFVAQVVKILGKSIMSTKAATTQSLIDFFASSKQIGSQMVECLQVLADKKTYIPAIAEAKLASTLVKVLEVLVSTLPEEYAQFHSPDCQDPQKGMAIAEEKICLLLRSLVRHSDIVFELKNADSISALIRNITMKDCPRENYHTRERSLQVIGAILDATEDNSFADHLHKKKCVSSLVNALKGIDTTQFQTVAIVVLTIETLLKKSIAHSTLLLRDFASANGYQMAQDAIVKCEQWIEKDPVLMNKILDAATELVFIGDVDQAPPEDDLQHIYFKLANIPREHRIRSITAFQALANAFLRTDKPELQSQLLERILYIFAVNPINYPIVHHLHNIALFIRNLDHLQEEIQTSVLKVLEYIVTGVNFMPFEELCNLVLLLKVDISMRLMCNIFTTIIKLIKFDSKYKDIFRDAKLIETIVYLFKQQDTTQPTENDRKYHREVLLPTMADLLLWMLEKSPANMLKFREADGVGVMQSLLTNETVRASALRVFQKLVAQDTLQNERDVSCLIEVLQTTPHSNLTLLTEIFNALKRMFHLNKKAKDAFRKNDGFVVTVSVLVRVQWPQDANLQHETFVMMESLFSMLTAALADHFKNKDFFNKNIGCSAMKSSLQLSGLLTAKTQHKIFQFLLDLATERSISADGSSDVYICGFLIPSHPRVWNPFALGLILDLVKSLELDFQSQVLKVFIYLAEAGQSILEAMSTVELGLFLLENYSSAVTDEEHLLHDDLLRILELIGSYRFTPLEWRKLLKMVHDDNQPLFLLQSLVRMSRNGSNTPFFELTDSSSAYLPNLDDRAWGPGTGYSFSCWIYFEKLGRDGTTSEAPSRPFVLLYLATEDKRCYLKLQLHPGGHFEIQTSPKTKPIDFTGFKFEEKQWYHVVVAHQRYRLQASIAVLYVNGKVIETKKVPFIAQNASGGQISGYIGAPLSVADVPVDGQLQHDDITWRIGPCLLYDDVMTDEMVTSHFVAGPSYTGCFQGDYLHGIGLLSDPIFPTYAQLIQNMDTSLLLSTLSSSDAPHQALSVVPQPLPSEKVVFAFNAKSVKLTGYIEDKKKPEAEATAENDTNYAYFLADIKDTGEKQLFARLDGKPVICCPSSISNDILNVNGLATILSLIDGAQTPEYLDASLSLLASLMVEPKILKEMERLGGYQIIGNFLRKKSSFMSPVILDTLWGIVTAGSVANKEIASNLRACKRFLLDYEIWKNADADLQKNLFNKLNSLVAETNAYAPWNHLRLRKTKIVTLLLHILHEAPPLETVETIATLLKSILAYRMLEEDVSHILSFLLTTLGVFVEVSKPGTTFAPSYDDLSRPIFKSRSSRKQPFGINQSIPIRNVIMRLLLDLLTGKHSETNIDLFHKVVSINWFFQFMDHGAHPVTAILALKLLVVLILARPAFATKFRNNNGFSLLKLVLGPYCNQDEVYSSLFSLLLGNNTIDICAQVEDLAELFSFLPDSKEKEDIPVQAPQVAGVVLRLVRLNAEFTDNYPLFSRQSTKQYFLTYSTRKVSLAQRRWAMVKVMVCALNGFRRATQWAEAQRSRKSGNNNDTIITNVNEEPSISGALSASQAVSAESSTTPQRLGGSSITIDPAALKLQPALLKRYHSPEEISTRTTINNIVIKFVSYLFEHSQTFKQICKTTEVLDELAGIIFAKQINLSSASFYRRAKLMSEGIQASSRNLGTTLMAAFAAPTDITHSTSQNLDDETKPSSPRNTSEIDPYSSVDDESGRRTPTSDTLKEVSVVSETGDIYDSANENSDDEEVRSLSALSTGSPISTGFFYRTSSTSDQMLSQSNRSSSPNSELDSPASFNTSSPLGPITANADAVFDNTTSDCIFEFMKIIIAWSFIHTSKGTSTLEDILEAYPPHTPRKWVVSYQDRIILSTIDYFSSDLSSAKLLHDGGKLMQNLARFSTLLIDRKAMDMFPSHDERVLDFFSLLVTRFEETTADPYSASSGSRVSRGKSVFVVTNAVSNLTNLTHNLANPIIANRIGGVNRSEYLAVVYHSLSKMFLHLLSFTNDKAPDVIEDVLNKLIGHLDIVLHPNNKDDEFLTCLCYIMYGFLLNDSTKVRSEALKFWKLILALRSKTPSLASILSYKNPKGETVDLLNNGFDKLLDKDYSSFMEWFSLNTETVAKYFEEHLHKSWRKYSDAENHARTVNKRERLAKQRNRTAKEQANIVDRFELIAALRKACSAELAKIKKEEAATARNRREQDIVRSNYAADQWQSICDYMEREKSIWRPADAVPDRQRLDFTEGPFRMRKKLEKCKANDIQHLVSSPTKPERRNPMPRNNSVRDDMLRPSLAAIEQAASTPPTEGQGKYLFSQFDKIEQLQGSATEKLSEVQLSASVQHEDSEEDEEDDDYDSEPEQESVSTEKPEETAESSQQQQDAGDDDNEIMDDDDDSGMHQKIQRLLEPGDKILHLYNCLRVTGLDAVAGIFLMCSKNIYIIDDYRIDENGEIVEVFDEQKSSWSNSFHEGSKKTVSVPSHSSSSSNLALSAEHGSKLSHKCRKWSYNDIRELHKRRYLLRPVALEFFCTDGRNYLVVFFITERDEVYNKLLSLDLPRYFGPKKEDKSWRKSMTKRWQKGEISNFQYLMFLNTLAGRSYNDLTQYPVFPWVLSDYTSEELDLTDPRVYRDLSKPMGALTEKRKQEFQQRFENWEDPTGQIPRFHYGTHYSSAGIVLYYLIRLEPFTKQSIKLQGGRFDHADRLFYSIQDTWTSASETAMSDVKELIPEFFYLPEFLTNHNKVNLGTRQTGQVVDDVELPPWAKNDPKLFILRNRQALESPYVSQHLHEWIDLIFGYKQTGKAAEEAMNVFYYLTYEGAVDIDRIENEVEKRATIAQINNFGQTPHQLFTKPHPPRQQLHPVIDPKVIYMHPEDLIHTEVKNHNEAVGQIHIAPQDPLRVISMPKNRLLVNPRCHKYFQWGFPDNSLRLRLVGSDQTLRVFEGLHSAQITCAAISDDGKLLALGGNDCVVSVWKVGKVQRNRTLNLKQRFCGHLRPISCIAMSSSYSVIISGSEDKTAIIWDMNRLHYVQRLVGHEGTVRDIVINHVSGEIITCAGTSIFVWNINGDLLAVSHTPKHPIMRVAITGGPEWLDNNLYITGHDDGCIYFWSILYSSTNKNNKKPDDDNNNNNSSSSSSSRSRSSSTASNDSNNTSLNNSLTAAATTTTATTIVRRTSQSPIANNNTLLRGCYELLLEAEHQTDTRAAITSLFVTPDQKRLYAGDVTGSVVCFHMDEGPSSTTATTITATTTTTTAASSVGAGSSSSITSITSSGGIASAAGGILASVVVGGQKDHWIKDNEVVNCARCATKFTTTKRRHHCRNCGRVVCAACSSKSIELPQLNFMRPVRVCEDCFELLTRSS